jgi:hypothetical protein
VSALLVLSSLVVTVLLALSVVLRPDVEVLLESFLEIVSATGFMLRMAAKVDAARLLPLF